MHIRLLRSVFLALITLVAILSAPWATHAQTPEQLNETTSPSMTAVQQEARYEAIQRMERYLITLPDGTFALTVKSGAEIGLDEATFAALYEGMQQTNAMLRSGSLQRSQVQTHTLPEDTAVSPITNDVTIDDCVGHNGVEWFWWGVRIFLNSCNAKSVAAGASLCLFIIGLDYCDLIAGALNRLAPGQIVVAERNGTGIWIDYNYALGIRAVQPQ